MTSRTIVSPVCTIAGVDRAGVNFLQQDITTNEIFVQCYTSSAPSYAVCVAVFLPDGTLDRFAQVDTDGAGGHWGWSGSPCNFGIAPGGQYIIAANPLVLSGPGITVIDRATLAHVQHITHGQYHRSMAVSADEVWAYSEGAFYNITNNAVGSIASVGGDYPAFDSNNNLWRAAGNTLTKFTPSYSGSVSIATGATYTPLGSTAIIGLSYLTTQNWLSIFGADGSVWLFDVQTETVLRQALSSLTNHGTPPFDGWTLPFNDYKTGNLPTYVVNATDGNFYFACPPLAVNRTLPMTTWGVSAPVFSTAAIHEHTQQNIWSAHASSSGDPANGIEILPYSFIGPTFGSSRTRVWGAFAPR